MEGQFKPLGDRILVRPHEKKENKTASGIILTESSSQSQKVEKLLLFNEHQLIGILRK